MTADSLPAGPACLRVVVLISGRGSNLAAILAHRQTGALAIDLRAVISNRAAAPGLELARAAGIPTRVVGAAGHPDPEHYDRALMAEIDTHGPDLVVLAGFMRILGPDFVRHYQGRLINIHPSLLPDFRGLDTHRRALAAGVTEHGASVHYVTEELDGGPLILQARVPVQPDDDPERLAARVLAQEHQIYPQVIAWIAAGRLRQCGQGVEFDGHRLARPLQWPLP